MAERFPQDSRLKGKRGLSRNGESGQMQNLLGEFKGLYEGRLKRLEEAEQNGEENLRVSDFLQVCMLNIQLFRCQCPKLIVSAVIPLIFHIKNLYLFLLTTCIYSLNNRAINSVVTYHL